MRRPSTSQMTGGGLGIAAMSYVAVDYMRYVSPTWHSRLMPVLWSVLALTVLSRVPFYKHWSKELRAALPFLGSVFFLLCALLFEALCVRSVTAVLGLDWHRDTSPLPDTGQWFLLALNESLPETIVEILRAHIIGLHHFLMLFVMLGFSVVFDSVKAPARPWCASARFNNVPSHPHRWAQKYYVPYAKDPFAIRQLLHWDTAYAEPSKYISDYKADWGSMSFLNEFLRPSYSEGSSWFALLKKAGGGCNDLLYSGHMLVAVLTAMAWTEAYGGFSSAMIWLFVAHSAQREVRERHHYTVDCIVAIYVGILLWKMTGFIWSEERKTKQAMKLEEIQNRLVHAAKDSDMETVRRLVEEMEVSFGEEKKQSEVSKKTMTVFACATVFTTLTIVILALTLTSDG
ncbi:Protein PHLOEM UNLOADING MODULATOR [Cardamine amara subsp. amara]|uniref:Protein PHLOEM UNLOADING MODULATOR n=1 Tax=Cardamine amara subsp. amara TaxID=228776 RepID=A0ABD0ZVX1_CARAN